MDTPELETVDFEGKKLINVGGISLVGGGENDGIAEIEGIGAIRFADTTGAIETGRRYKDKEFAPDIITMSGDWQQIQFIKNADGSFSLDSNGKKIIQGILRMSNQHRQIWGVKGSYGTSFDSGDPRPYPPESCPPTQWQSEISTLRSLVSAQATIISRLSASVRAFEKRLTEHGI